MTEVPPDSLGRLSPAPTAWFLMLALLPLLLGALPRPASAQATAEGSLQTLVEQYTARGIYQYNALERQSAIANDKAYQSLLSDCGSTGAACTGARQTLFMRLRELEDTANELLGRQGETQYSLRLDPQGLGDALRWTAPEEYAAQGSMASKFVNSQASVLTNRLSALRFASQGIRVADGVSVSPTGNGVSFASTGGALGGAAGADDSLFSRLSLFANGSFGSGEKAPTVFEDAFFFDSTEVSAGADVRITNRWVAGLLLGHTEKRVDFNSARSVVEGAIRGNGESAIAYAQYETDAAFVNLAAGWQRLSLATNRKITYPSNNPAIAPVNVTSHSNTGSTALIATLGTGYSLHYEGLSAEPYLNAQYARTKINAFTEYSDDGFDIDTPTQTIQSLEGSAGLRAQYSINLPIGVLVPYAYGEFRHQFRDSSRDINSGYSAAGDGTDFSLPTDDPDKNYYVVGAGGSVVLTHGLQGFMQYSRLINYTNYTDHTVSGGVRWEF